MIYRKYQFGITRTSHEVLFWSKLPIYILNLKFKQIIKEVQIENQMHFTLKKFTGFINFVRAFNMNLVANRNLFQTKPCIVNCKKIGLATFILLVVCRCMLFLGI